MGPQVFNEMPLSSRIPEVSVQLPEHVNEPSEPLSEKTSTPENEALRVLHDHNGEAIYTEPSHWMSILQEIKFVRANLPPQEFSPPSETPHAVGQGLESDFDVSLNLGPCDRLSIPDALTSLPAQPVCDMLLSRYFNSRYMVLGTSPSFFRLICC